MSFREIKAQSELRIYGFGCLAESGFIGEEELVEPISDGIIEEGGDAAGTRQPTPRWPPKKLHGAAFQGDTFRLVILGAELPDMGGESLL